MLTSKAAEMMVSELNNNGWKVFGFRSDQSDFMTDYYCPAYFEGIASKDGYVLLINAYSTSNSGYKKEKKTFKVDHAKIKKLEATMNDAAATENEKAVCQKKIDEMFNKEKESAVVIEEYPTFSFATPKKCTWHIEKDGVIIAKGVGATDESIGRNKEAVLKLIKRFEKEIKNNSQLESTQKEVKTVVIKPVTVTDRQTIQENDVLTFDYHGHYWLVTSVYTRNDGKKCATYERLGAASRGYKQLKNADRYYDYTDRMEKNVQEGKIKIHTLQEIEEITYKTVYKKVSRKVEEKPVQEENLLAGEVSEATEENKTINKVEDTQENTATKRQRFALHMASKRTIDTREIVISKEKASELIGKSKQGEDITEELRVIAGIIEEVEETVKEEIVKNETVEDEKEMTEEQNVNMEALADTFSDIVCEIGKPYSNMDELEKETTLNKLMKFMLNREIVVTGDDLFYLQNNYPVLYEIVKEINGSSKIKVKTIEFVWSESGEIEDGLTVNTFKEADEIISKAAFKAPNDGCYDKTKFTVTFEDGQTYTGRMDIEYKHFGNYTLSGHIIDHCTFYTGENKPSHMTDEEYQLHVDRAEMKESYKFFLDTYQLEDEEEGITPPQPSKNEAIELDNEINEKQLETLNKRLEKEHVKPLALYKDNRINSIVLECLNTNLENPSRFCFSIDEKGTERGKGYAYPTDELQLIKLYNNESEELEELFYHESLTDGQNKAINRLCNHWKGSDKFTFLSVHKSKSDSKQVILEVKGNIHKTISFMHFNLEGHMLYSGRSLDQVFNPTELLHEFNESASETVEVETPAASEIAYKLNEERNGVEIYFNEKPSEEVRSLLKANKYRYSSRAKCWYAKQSDKTIELAEQLSNGSVNNETVTYEDVNIDDCTEYTVSQELVNRENDSNWIFRREKKDHNKDLQEHFIDYTNKVKEIVSTTDKESIIYNLKSSLQRYKKKYHETYVKQLTVKANNPSWAVTGRAGRNMNRYNKEMDRSNKLMFELVELTSNMDKAIEKAKRDIKKLEKEAVKNEVSNVSVDGYTFKTITKTTDTHKNIRMYELNGYYIAKTWGAFRIYFNNKEVHAMKTNETLKDAKQYVVYLLQKEKDAVTA
ncbi:LPD25 domain-containing protein [Priestia aryabhattai]|uniref:LPD25 domain-containing protein n=1 Tax=Priestia aryabhattai TaxID=412384 RepID=UPI0015F51F4C|nr:LPD25 domain-containing protein [Priestia aryabhattai]